MGKGLRAGQHPVTEESTGVSCSSSGQADNLSTDNGGIRTEGRPGCGEDSPLKDSGSVT